MTRSQFNDRYDEVSRRIVDPDVATETVTAEVNAFLASLPPPWRAEAEAPLRTTLGWRRPHPSAASES